MEERGRSQMGRSQIAAGHGTANVTTERMRPGPPHLAPALPLDLRHPGSPEREIRTAHHIARAQAGSGAHRCPSSKPHHLLEPQPLVSTVVARQYTPLGPPPPPAPATPATSMSYVSTGHRVPRAQADSGVDPAPRWSQCGPGDLEMRACSRGFSRFCAAPGSGAVRISTGHGIALS
eukprot:3936514-Rhodomonas_salina.5